jgi:hypothetical protein
MYTVYIHYSFDINYHITCSKLFHRFYFLPPPPLYVQNIFWPPLHWSKIFYGPSKFPPAPYPALIMTGPLLLRTLVWSLFVDCFLPTDKFLKKALASNECWLAFRMLVSVPYGGVCECDVTILEKLNFAVINNCNKQLYFVTFGEN